MIVEEVRRFQHSLILELGQAINKAIEKPRGIRNSWTGWTRKHEKIKGETLRSGISRPGPHRSRLKALNGMVLI